MCRPADPVTMSKTDHHQEVLHVFVSLRGILDVMLCRLLCTHWVFGAHVRDRRLSCVSHPCKWG